MMWIGSQREERERRGAGCKQRVVDPHEDEEQTKAAIGSDPCATFLSRRIQMPISMYGIHHEPNFGLGTRVSVR